MVGIYLSNTVKTFIDSMDGTSVYARRVYKHLIILSIECNLFMKLWIIERYFNILRDAAKCYKHDEN